MEEAFENGKELSHSAHADGMNDHDNWLAINFYVCVHYFTFLILLNFMIYMNIHI